MMKTSFESRYAISPNEAKKMDTAALRQNFLMESLFEADAVKLTLSHFDRYITGGVMPVKETVALSNPENLKAAYFL